MSRSDRVGSVWVNGQAANALMKWLSLLIFIFAAFACGQHDEGSLPEGLGGAPSSGSGSSPDVGHESGASDRSATGRLNTGGAATTDAAKSPADVGIKRPSLNDAATREFIAAHPPHSMPAIASSAAPVRATASAPAFDSTNKVRTLGSPCPTPTLVTDHPTATYNVTGQYVVVGQTIVWTARADCTSAQYRFVLHSPDGVWTEAQAWSTNATFSWNTAGLPLGFYDIQVWVRNGDTGSYDAYLGRQILINDAAQCTDLSVSPNSAEAHYAVKGETIHFSVASPSCTGQVRYKFWLLGPGDTTYAMVRDWSNVPTFDFDTTNRTSGYWALIVWVSNVPFYDNYYESYAWTSFIVNDWAACTSATVTPDDADSTAPAGQIVTWTATSSCAGPAEYRFVFHNQNEPWVVTQEWSSSNTFIWNTAGKPGGFWDVQVWVRDAPFYDYEQAYGSHGFVLDAPLGIPTDAAYLQDFSSLTAAAVGSLPIGWKIDKKPNPRALGTYGAAVLNTEQRAGAGLPANSANGIYNFGAGVADAQATNFWLNSNDRAPGWLSAGSDLTTGGTKSGNLYLALRAPADEDLTGLSIGYDVEKYGRGTNAAGFRVQLHSSIDGNSWTSAGNNFLTLFGADAAGSSGYDTAPGATVPVPVTKLVAGIPRGSLYYLAWNYTLNSSSSNDGSAAQALAIDNVSVKGELECATNCASKQCGDNLSDGCGGTCPPLCGNGAVGCVTNGDCRTGLSCSGQAPGAAAPNVCQPTVTGQCSGSSLFVNPSPRASLGAHVSLSTTTACGLATPEYRFAFGPSNDTTSQTVIADWSPSNTATWNTSGVASGSYVLYAYVRAIGNSGFDALGYGSLLLGSTCDSASLSVSPESPYPTQGTPPLAGTPITLTGSAECAGDGTVPEFRYYYTPPGTSVSYVRIGCPNGAASCPDVWTTGPIVLDTTNFKGGAYGFFVQARAHGNLTAQESQAWWPYGFLLGPVCTTTTLWVSPDGPQLAGTPVTLGASPTCQGAPGENKYYYFNYYTDVSWHEITPGYTSSPATWDTSALPPGTYQIQVVSRRVGNTSSAESYAVNNFVLDAPTTVPTDLPITQDFNSLSVSGIATLPSGWRIDKHATPDTLGTFVSALPNTELNGGAALAANSLNGIYNFGAGVSAAEAPNYWGNSNDRAPGWLASGSTVNNGGTKSGNLYVALRAPADKDLSGVYVGYDIEKYKPGINASGFRVQLYSSTDGASWNSAGDSFLSRFTQDASNVGYDPAPGNKVTVGPTKLQVNVPRNTPYYLAWNYTSGSATDASNAQALAIDNVSIKGEACTGSCANKHCGADPSDGCGGVCTITCAAGESGCLLDTDCAGGLHCASRSADAAAAKVCIPTTCASSSACTAECPCGSGATCAAESACASGFTCTGGVCTTGTNSCHDGVKDNDETDVDCGGACAACVVGKACNADADCQTDEVCGVANGACFGKARAERVCWRAECNVDTSYSCGQADSSCGVSCDCATACDVNASTNACPSGEVCKSVGQLLFDVPQNDVCVDPACPSNDPTLCGSSDSRCGPNCICVANCSSATCSNPGDGCGGQCPGVCPTGSVGCTDDINCPTGNLCIENGDGTSVCRPASCAFKTLAPPLCGSAGAPCGETCPVCTPSCDGRHCGNDPDCGQSCGSCSAGSYCSADGQCVSPPAPLPVTVPNQNGGVRVLARPLPLSTTPVGAVDGQFSVSDDGSTLYDIPIEVPPGRAGVQPALTISYGASKANGDIGVGWRLQGLSKITRCPHSFGVDGAAGPIKNDATDAFCIDGKRLEVMPGSTYGANDAEYRTMIDTFSKIKSFSDSDGGLQLPGHAALVARELQGPDYFRVWTKEGKLLTFGQTRDSLVLSRTGIRYAWLLNRVEDRASNSMQVAYTNTLTLLTHDNGNVFGSTVAGTKIRPDFIAYTGHGAIAGDRRVVFSYESRDDEQLTFGQGGTTYIGPERLSRVTTYVDANPVKNYRFQYGPGIPSQVAKIFECTGDSDSTCKNPTSFEYSTESGFPPVLSEYSIPTIEGAGRLDINGDGIPDHLLTTAQLNGVDSSPTLAAAQISTDVAVGFGSYAAGPVAGIAINVIWNLIKGDFWGVFGDSPSYTIKHQIYVGSHDRSALQLLDNIGGIRCADIETSGKRHPTFLTDFDDDGKDDIVTACGPNNGDLYVAKSLGNGQFQGLTQGLPSNGDPVLRSALGTGQGGVTNPRGSCPSCLGWVAPILTDINGDSLLDAVTCKDHYTLNVWLRLPPPPLGPDGAVVGGADFASYPLVLEAATIPASGAHGVPSRAVLPLCGDAYPSHKSFDIDGDGTSDLIVRGQDHWSVLRYVPGPNPLSFQPVTITDVGGTKGSAGGALALADFNGDGLADLWNTTDTMTTVWLNAGGGVFTSRTLAHPTPALSADSRFRRNSAVALDYDADGRSDILENWFGTPGFFTSYNASLITNSKVDRFLSATQAKDVAFYDPLAGQNGTLHFLLSSDLDGDGNTDVFGSGHIAYGTGAAGKLLTKVVDGLGNFTKIKYDGDSYQTDASCQKRQWPERCLARASGLVTQHQEGMITASGSEVIEHTFKYAYTNGRVNVTGEGWLGFDQRRVQEYRGDPPISTGGFAQTPISETTIDYEPLARYDLEGQPAQGTTPPFIYPLAGLPKTITIDQHSSDQFALIAGDNVVGPLRSGEYDPRVQTKNYWSVRLSASGRPYPFTDLRISSTYDILTGSGSSGDNNSLLRRCETSLTPDGYGNVKESLERCQAFTQTYTVHPIGDHAPYQVTTQGFLESTDIKTDFRPDPTNWLISFPKSRTIQSKIPEIVSTSGGSSGTPLLSLVDDTQSWAFTYTGDALATVTRNATQSTPAEQQRITTYDRDSYGNVYQITEQVPNQPSRVTQVHFDYEHDAYYPQYIDNSANERTQLRFDPFWGKPTVVTDASGVSRQSVYDDFGLLREESGPTGSTINTYSPIANPRTQTAAGHIEPRVQVTVDSEGADGEPGVHRTTELDNRGRVVRSMAPGFKGTQVQNIQVLQEQSYDDATGLLVGKTLAYATDSSGSNVLAAPHDTYAYDGLHRPIRITHSDGTFKEFQYASRLSLAGTFGAWLDGLGDVRPMSVVRSLDETGHQNVRITDFRGRIIRTIDGNNVASDSPESTNYQYTSFGRLESITDNLGHAIRYSYDCYGRELDHTDPDLGISKYTYTGFDELATATDPAAGLSTYSRDSLGRLRRLDSADGATRWVYDNQGRLSDTYSPATEHNSAGNHVRYDYEPPAESAAEATGNRGLLQKATYTIEGSDYAVSFDYDGLGRAERVHYPLLGTGPSIIAKYTYEGGSGALREVEEVGSVTHRLLWQGNSAYQGHLLNHETFGNGAETTYDYDQQRHWLNNLHTVLGTTQLGTTQIQDIGYTRYDDGQVHTRNTEGITPLEYVYDPLNRLSQTIERPATGAGHTADFRYDDLGNITQRDEAITSYRPDAPHLVDTVDGNSYEYDGNGNVRSRSGPDIPGGQQFIDYTTFNLPKTVTTSGVGTTTFEYSADRERLIRRDPATTLHFVGSLYMRKLDPDATTTHEERFRIFAGARQIGEIVRADGSDRTLYFHADHLGSIETVSDSDGNWSQQDTDPFGKPINPQVPAITRVGFTGQEHDRDLGLVDMKGRIYDPVAARFMSPDPVMQAPYWSQGLNRYSYVFNNPINMTDPSGFEGEDPLTGLGMIVYGTSPQSEAGFSGISAVSGGSAASSLASTLLGGGVAGLSNVVDSLLFGNLGGGHAGGALQNIASSATPSGSSGGTGGASAQAAAQNKGGGPNLVDDRDRIQNIIDNATNNHLDGMQPGGGDLLPQSPSDGVSSDECMFGNCHVRHPGMQLSWNDRFGRPNENIWKAQGNGEGAESPNQGSSASRMNQEVKRGKAPDQVKRVDSAHPPEDPQDHAHLEDGTRVRRDGTTKPEGAKIPNVVARWLRSHGWPY